ncbi:hypothetical protein KGF86_06930 [Ornithinibacillus massiliensis]|uniref:Uncharacterized protein n=1 Tax=Ornithinibacillus massiliensis TaxID=1944633 RepID=A0ABS5MC80_9BACI|nr:hypothetical protein [Ornithinibacillus massiliensis]MBS3679941.1 hypothetical protein [Ornithinibacillus massiliensis]
MNIYQALKQTDFRFAEYFKYLHPELRFDRDRPLKSEEEFLKTVNRKSMSPFYRWEKSNEYKNLLMLYLDYKVNDDYEDIYNLVSKKAKETGDPQTVKLFLQLQKDIQSNAKLVKHNYKTEIEDHEKDEDEFDLS